MQINWIKSDSKKQNRIYKEKVMPKVAINTPAPDFELEDYKGNKVKLSDFKGKTNVILIFNRTFT